MRTFRNILLAMLAVYLVASLAASLIVNLSDDIDLVRDIVNARYGLLIVSWFDPATDTIAILSPFCNHPDIFLLVIDFTEGIELYTDGFDFFFDF